MEIQGKYVKNMRKYKGTIIVLIVCMIFAYLYAHVDKKEYFYNRTVDVEKYANTGVICEKKLTQDVYSTEKSLDGIQVKTQNVGVGVGSGYSLQPGTDHSEMYTEEF